jgi:hypothetical protein
MLANQVLYHLSHTSSPFNSGYFGDGVSQTICPGWSQTMIFPVSASQIATGIPGCGLKALMNFAN